MKRCLRAPADQPNPPAMSPQTQDTPPSGLPAAIGGTLEQVRSGEMNPAFAILLVLLIGGGLLIMARYLIFTDSNWPTLVGLAAILGGLYTATKWQ